MKPYVVQQGDYLAKLAHTKGFDADAVWNDPKNAEIAAKRKPNLLYPGDVLYLPDEVLSALLVSNGTSNRYLGNVPSVPIHLSFTRAGDPVANEACRVLGLGESFETSTDGEGNLTLSVPVNVRELSLLFIARNVIHSVRVGDMDPIEETSGIDKRLAHLGFYHPDEDDDAGRGRQRAIARFQTAQGLPSTGELDEATKNALVEAHGS